MKKPDYSIQGMLIWCGTALFTGTLMNIALYAWFAIAGWIFMMAYNHIIFKIPALTGLVPMHLDYLESMSMLYVIGIPVGILRSAVYKREMQMDAEQKKAGA